MKFDNLDLEDSLQDGLDAMNFQEMTPVQELAIPPLMEGKDVIACAQTGTGKTIAYLLPVLNNLCSGNHSENDINAVVMVPTRELAVQIDQQVAGLSYFLSVSSVAVYGGTDGIVFSQQERGLQMGADIVIATPGRLLSHINLKTVDLSKVSFFILDEADRMLDMGFHEDIIQIYKQLPKTCQIIMFSATMPQKIKMLAEKIMKNPVDIRVAISKPPESIIQTAYICRESQKMKILENHLNKNTHKRFIIFSSSKLKVKELAASLKRLKINVSAMHSDLEQKEREQVMKDFKNGNIDILVATDVVARGIDINNIKVIINYDIPKDPEDYVHRIGRTARGINDSGLAITFVSEKEQSAFKAIENFLGKSIYKIPIEPSFGDSIAYEPDRHRQRRSNGHSPGRNNKMGYKKSNNNNKK
jgi:superfamily II DNA/RNA helicase